MEVTFQDVNAQRGASGRALLSGVSGRLQPGTLTALMGPSGSGKTTLLSAIGRRFEAGLKYGGKVRYDGNEWRVSDKRRVAFVPQDDVFPVGVTVREHLEFSSRLRIGNVPVSERRARVVSLIKVLRLEQCADTVMGGAAGTHGVSGGERKSQSRSCSCATR